MKKNIVLYYPYEGEKKYLSSPFEGCHQNIEIRQKPMIEEFISANIHVYLVRHASNYIGENDFLVDYLYKNHRWEKKENCIITADICLGLKIPKNVSHIFPSLSEYMRDKRVIERLFPQYTLHSLECSHYQDIQDNFSKISTSYKVLKPYNGSQGNGVIISNTIPKEDEIDENLYPYLLQEFIDTSDGFCGYPGHYDLRIIILSGKIIGKILRQPKQGKYIANVAQDGILRDLCETELPKDIQEIIKEIDAYFSKISMHRYYSIDFGRDRSGVVKIFEMNSYPGLGIPKVAKELGKYIIRYMI